MMKVQLDIGFGQLLLGIDREKGSIRVSQSKLVTL